MSTELANLVVGRRDEFLLAVRRVSVPASSSQRHLRGGRRNVLVVGTCSAQRSSRVLLLVLLLFRQLVEEATPGGAQRFGRGRQQTAHVPMNLSRLSQSPTGVTRRFDSSLNSRKEHKINKKQRINRNDPEEEEKQRPGYRSSPNRWAKEKWIREPIRNEKHPSRRANIKKWMAFTFAKKKKKKKKNRRRETQRYPSGKEETIKGRFVVTGIRSPGIVAHPRTATPGSTGWKNTHTHERKYTEG